MATKKAGTSKSGSKSAAATKPAATDTPIENERTADDQSPTEPMFREDRVRLVAYQRFLARGDEPGDPVADWLEAEAEVDSEDADAA